MTYQNCKKLAAISLESSGSSSDGLDWTAFLPGLLGPEWVERLVGKAGLTARE